MTAERVAAHVAAVVALLTAEGADSDAATLTGALGRTGRERPVVVVAGEVKRGKSSMVNALLGRADLSPTGTDVVTGAPIAFFHHPAGEPPGGRAEVLYYGSDDPTAVTVEQARAMASVEFDTGDERTVRSVRIGVDHPLLEQIELVDTPGVGGLNSGHAALTLQSLGSADALAFVIEAGAQLRAAELEFLRRAAARIDTVILVLTKVDLHRGWRTVLDDNRAILRDQAPRFADCPVVPVSSTLAMRGLGVDDPEEAAVIRREAGFGALEAVLEERVAARAAILADANLVRNGLGRLNMAERNLVRQRELLAPDGTARGQFDAERARLADLQEDRATWPQLVDAEIRKLTLERSEAIGRGTAEIRRRYEERLKNVSKSDHDSLPGELMADLTALAGSLNEQAADRLSRLVFTLLDGMDSAEPLDQTIGELTSTTLQAELDVLDLGSHTFSSTDRLSILSSFSSGHSLAGLVTGSGLITTAGLMTGGVALAVGFGVGSLYAFTTFRNKRRQLFASEFTAWMREQCTQAQLTVNNSFSRAMIDVGSEIKAATRGALAQRERDIGAALNRAKAVLAEEDKQVQQSRKELDESLATLRALRAEARSLLAALG